MIKKIIKIKCLGNIPVDSLFIWICARSLDFAIILITPILILRIFKFIKQIPSESISKPTYPVFLIITLLIEFVSKFLTYGPLKYNNPGYIISFFVFGYIANIIPTILFLLVLGVPCRYLSKSIKYAIREDQKLIDVVTFFKQFQNMSSSYIFLVFTGYTCRLTLSSYTLAYNMSCRAFDMVCILYYGYYVDFHLLIIYICCS